MGSVHDVLGSEAVAHDEELIGAVVKSMGFFVKSLGAGCINNAVSCKLNIAVSVLCANTRVGYLVHAGGQVDLDIGAGGVCSAAACS